jgi:hypothetical protein
MVARHRSRPRRSRQPSPPNRNRHRRLGFTLPPRAHPPSPLYVALMSKQSEVSICHSALPLHRTRALTPSPHLLRTVSPMSHRRTPPQTAPASIHVHRLCPRAVPQPRATAAKNRPRAPAKFFIRRRPSPNPPPPMAPPSSTRASPSPHVPL